MKIPAFLSYLSKKRKHLYKEDIFIILLGYGGIQMEYERMISGFGGSTGISLPHDLLKYLKLEKGDKVIVTDQVGKYGPYITVWKKIGDVNDDNSQPTQE